MKKKIAEMTIEQLQSRAAEIDGMELSTLQTDEISTLAEERELITARLAELRLLAARKNEERGKALDSGGTVKKVAEDEEKRTYTVDSPEYRTAFLKVLQKTPEQRMELGWSFLTKEEREAYITVTTDTTNHTGYLIPTETLNRIWDMIDEQHSILADIEIYRDTKAVLNFPKRVSISQGDADDVTEATANDDEKNVWGQLVLTGKEFSKSIDISYKMMNMAIPAFENFIINEIAERMGSALAADVIASIASGYDSTYNAVTSAAVKAVAYKDIADTLACIKNREGNIVIYGNNTSIYKYLVGMVDTTGRPIYQPNAQAGEEGILVGKAVKVEDAIADNIFWIGCPKAVKGNMVNDIIIENDKNIKTHVHTYSGYCDFECGLIAPKAFAKLTVKQS